MIVRPIDRIRQMIIYCLPIFKAIICERKEKIEYSQRSTNMFVIYKFVFFSRVDH
jgi:hypothetical protein